jgi:hypothetical protein
MSSAQSRQELPLNAVHTPSERKFGSSWYRGYHLLGETELSEPATHFIPRFIPISCVKEVRDTRLDLVLLWFGNFSKLTRG